MNSDVPGFNGERRDPVSGHLHPGQGYRAYSPALMRFTCPDRWSPSGSGGINPYVYCAGDPVNRADPSGHTSLAGWVNILGGIVGILSVPFTGGSSLAITAVLAAMSGVLAVASAAEENAFPEASAIMGWISLAAGLPGIAEGVWRLGRSVSSLYRQGAGLISKLERVNGHIGIPMSGRRGYPDILAEYHKPAAKNALTWAERQFWIHSNLKHDLSSVVPGRMRSGGWAAKITHKATYQPDVWEFRSVFRKPTSPVYASDVTEYQYAVISQRQGFFGVLPRVFISRDVINETTLEEIDGLAESDMPRVFLTRTPVGKLVHRRADLLGLAVTSVKAQANENDGLDFITGVVPLVPM
jgi:RHS repeat-associated protein